MDNLLVALQRPSGTDWTQSGASRGHVRVPLARRSAIEPNDEDLSRPRSRDQAARGEGERSGESWSTQHLLLLLLLFLYHQELAAKIGQELLERNRFLDDKVNVLENQIEAANEVITQLRHELQMKTDLLRAYNSNEENFAFDDASPIEIRNVNVDLLNRKIQELEADNRRLQEQATEVNTIQLMSVHCQPDQSLIEGPRVE